MATIASTPKRFVFVLSVVVLGVLVAVTLIHLNNAEGSLVKNVRISNITGNSATISWITDEPRIGRVYINANSEIANGQQLFMQAFSDDRDADNLHDRRITHHATVYGLQPNTQYFFAIGGTWSLVKPEVDSLKTVSLAENLGAPKPIYGKVVNFDRSQSNPRDGLVYYEIISEDLNANTGSTFNSSFCNYNTRS